MSMQTECIYGIGFQIKIEPGEDKNISHFY